MPEPEYPQHPDFKSYSEMVAWFNKNQLTPCRTDPESCEDREIKHVVLDADDTIWDIHPAALASNCQLPVTKETETKFSTTSYGGFPTNIHLKPGLLETLDELKKRGIGVSVASHNPDRKVNKLLDSMGLLDRFDFVVSTYQVDKDAMVQAIANKSGIPEKNVLFVDDSVANAEDVALSTEAMALVMGYDIKDIGDILKVIDGKGLKNADR